MIIASNDFGVDRVDISITVSTTSSGGGIEEPGTDEPGTDEHTVEPVTAEHVAPTVDISHNSVVSTIMNFMQTIFGDTLAGVKVAAFDGQTVERSTSDVQAGDVPAGQQAVVVLPVLVVTESKIYVFSVKLNLPRGIRIHMRMNRRAGREAGFEASDEADEEDDASS